MRSLAQKRSGVALLLALVVMSTLSFLMVTITTQILLNRRVVERRMHQVQALWLARSGLEVATVRLADDKRYTGETLQLVEDSEVHIRVKPEDGRFKIDIEAAYPTNSQNVVVRTAQK